VVFLSLGTAAWTAAFHWRAPIPVVLGAAPELSPPPRAGAASPRRTIPAMLDPSLDRSGEIDPWRAESRAYAPAHQAHFVDDDPARALAGWNGYLHRYPAGTFAPEARFNRALILVRLGRFDDAAQALDVVARDRASAYPHPEACALLHWLGRRSSRPVGPPAPGCDDLPR
jgi:TolA-binding protein